MKITFVAAALLAASASSFAAPAGVSPAVATLTSIVSGSLTTAVFEAANRKGSKRVGGTGRSGKGGRYVGGRK